MVRRAKPGGEQFKVDRMVIKDNEECPRLAAILEQREEKEGLTIIVS